MMSLESIRETLITIQTHEAKNEIVQATDNKQHTI